MQAVCDAEYKGSLTAPHTLLDLKQSLERNEFKSYSEVQLRAQLLLAFELTSAAVFQVA
jgi:hypothetical protein